MSWESIQNHKCPSSQLQLTIYRHATSDPQGILSEYGSGKKKKKLDRINTFTTHTHRKKAKLILLETQCYIIVHEGLAITMFRHILAVWLYRSVFTFVLFRHRCIFCSEFLYVLMKKKKIAMFRIAPNRKLHFSEFRSTSCFLLF